MGPSENQGIFRTMNPTTDLLTRIEQTLDSMRPYISSHKGTVEVVDFDEAVGTLLLRMGGTCHGCSASTIPCGRGSRRGSSSWCPKC